MELDAASLRSELKRLRRDEGRTLVKLRACLAVRAALGDPPEHELHERFDAAVAALGNDMKSLALKNAYGIGQSNPLILTTRRENFGAQPEVSRGPETINNWENEKIEELAARLLAGQAHSRYDQLLVAVAITAGVITVVAEGEAMSGKPMRQSYNPSKEPFVPAFIYQLPPYAAPDRLTVCGLFMDSPPTQVFAMGSGDLLAFVCGDGRQKMDIQPGGIPGIEAAAHVAVHWDQPTQGVFYGFQWA